ncbi:MAG TPA: DUF6599 family protein [Phycisphaerae bacterium]|nr:DUF6599 family protein [Phycisphaerae bacterium]
MKWRIVLMLAVVAAATGCRGAADRFQFDPQRLVPHDRRTRAWELAAEPKVYGRDNLWEYLDGQAPTYLDYGMATCIHAEYRHKYQPDRKLILDLFDMGDAEGAFGLLSAGRRREAETLQIGSLGYWQDGRACWMRDRVFAQVIVPDAGLASFATASYMALLADKAIDLPPTLPPALEALPQQDRIAGTESFVARDMLGHDFLGAGWMADYEYRAGLEYRVFWVPCADAAQAQQRLEALRRFGAQNGRVFDIQAGVGRTASLIISNYTGRLFVVADSQDLAGTVDCLDEQLAVQKVNALLERARTLRTDGRL